MIKYEISGQLYFAEESHVSLESYLAYQTENDLKVSIKNSSGKNQLDVILKVISERKESAIIRADNELERISNLISWFHGIPVVKWKISGITFSEKKDSLNAVAVIEAITISERLYIKKILDNKSLKRLNKQLTENYNNNFEEILIMWRQALAEESKGLKFFLFYKILEKLCGNWSKVDKLVKDKINTVETRDNGMGNKVTIFTFLRDNIHPKGPKFPYNEIEQYLPRLQDLVRKKIHEDFSSYSSV